MDSEVMTQLEAWEVYDRWLEDTRIVFLDEPSGLEPTLRLHSRRRRASPNDWADSYLLAFSSFAGLTLVSFDRALRGRTENLLLLG